MFIEILLIYSAYIIIILIGSYYVNLYISKDQFTKEEFKDVFPYVNKFWNALRHRFSPPVVAVIIGISSLIGILLPMLTQNWFLNSSILFLIMFFTFPLIKKNFEKAKVTMGNKLSDSILNLFITYENIILIGFGAGTATAMMYNWGTKSAPLHFLWFIINIIALSIMLGISIKNTME